MIQLELYGSPVPWSVAFGKGKPYNPKSVEKEQARWQIKAQYRDKPIEGYFVLNFKFWMPIPKNTSKIRRQQMLNEIIIPENCDTTNCQKFYEDCLKGIVITDDRRTADVQSKKRYSEKPGILIQVIPWDEYRGLAINENIRI